MRNEGPGDVASHGYSSLSPPTVRYTEFFCFQGVVITNKVYPYETFYHLGNKPLGMKTMGFVPFIVKLFTSLTYLAYSLVSACSQIFFELPLSKNLSNHCFLPLSLYIRFACMG